MPSFDLMSRSRGIYEPKWHGNSVSHAERFLKSVTVALRTFVTLCLYAFPMVVRLTQEEATKRMLALGFEPLEAFVSTKTPWKSRHIVCGNIVSPKLGLVSSPKRNYGERSTKIVSQLVRKRGAGLIR